ncbi:MAG: alkaline phosphatase family protein, partial [Pseudomonadota bacterium]
ILENSELAPDLCLTYLPTLDYELQRKNPDDARAFSIVQKKVESQISRLTEAAVKRGYEILIFGDYHIAPVDGAIFPNMALREAGLMKVRRVKAMAYPDFYTSMAFTMVDHEIAHVYIRDVRDIPVVKEVLKNVPGVAELFDREAQRDLAIDHGNSGELIIMAQEGKWLAYPWWRERCEAPDFAMHVDIHNKPGYDPCELFFGWPPGSVSMNTFRIKGSHGRVGPGREVVWASTLSFPEKPSDLIELSRLVRSWLRNKKGRP